ncbi:MAG: DUF2974 domain-containing protein [Treponema sp.]|nr:DUF2974 domain-containing protein [Treponema sp.]
MNLLDYLDWRGDLTFKDAPFNEVDTLIFSHIIYLHFQGLISDNFKQTISLGQLAENLLNAPDFEERIHLGLCINELTDDLFFKCAKTRRFKDIKVCAFRSIYDEEKCEQFAALTFIYGDLAFVTYRGTDDTIIGWKEDFLLSYMDPYPSQSDALIYLNEAIKSIHKKFTVIGHSKGGNLAVYASTKALPKYQKRIQSVYNLDGPGFLPEFFEKEDFCRIQDKVINIFPEDDYVGGLQFHSKSCQIIKAASRGIAQHDPLNWQCLGSKFLPAQDFTKESKFFSKTINDWNLSMTNEEKCKFVTALFDLYLASGCKTNYELSKNILPASKKVLKAFNEMDKETKKEVKRLINMLKDCIKSELPIFNFFSRIPLDLISTLEEKFTSKKDAGESPENEKLELPLKGEI